MSKVLGDVRPDPVAVVLGTGYSQFKSSTGVDGLAKVDGTALHILAVVANLEGNGCFRRFIEQAKQEFESIAVWSIHNPWLPSKLEQYGFEPASSFQCGQVVQGYKWIRASQP